MTPSTLPKPVTVPCCYCHQPFEVAWTQGPGQTFEEACEQASIGIALLRDGLPLECGNCRDQETGLIVFPPPTTLFETMQEMGFVPNDDDE